ncbi:MAG: pitrilysin family protein [Woeseiaceae bacterium]|nr:pitrilysin family protein [Woeseiaceae bacterium]
MRSLAIVGGLFFASLSWANDVTLPDYERVVLDNGAVLLLAAKHDVPLVGMRAVVRGGSVADPAEKAGLADLLASVLQKGAGNRDAAEFAEAAASVGGNISASADVETVEISAEFLSRDIDLMIELVADMLMRPTLAEDEVNKERDRAIALIAAAKDSNLSGLMPSYTNAFIFGEHPFGNPTFGSESTLAAITGDDVVQYHADNFGGDRLIVAVAGDFQIDALKARLTTVFGAWEPAATPLPEIPAPDRALPGRVLLVDKPGAAQTYFRIGNVGVAVDYPRRAELNLANTVFGGRFTSMLMTELRVKSGLTYGASSRVARHSEAGAVTIRSYTETAKTVEAIDMAIDILGRLHDRGLNDEMIESARNYIMGQFPPSLETASSLAGMFAFLEEHELDRTYIDDYGAKLAEATPVSVSNAIADVYPQTDDLVFVLIGDADEIREAVAKYGEVTEIAITEPRFKPLPSD